RALEEHVAHWAARLATEPAEAVRRLEGTSAGCDWLIERWEELLQALADQGAWMDEQRDRALRLIGAPGPVTIASEARPAPLVLHNLAAQPAWYYKVLDEFFGIYTGNQETPQRRATYQELLPAAADGRAALEGLVRGEITRLTERREAFWEQFDGPNRADAAECALVDDTAEGARLLRYEATHARAFHHTYHGLLRRRQQARSE